HGIRHGSFTIGNGPADGLSEVGVADGPNIGLGSEIAVGADHAKDVVADGAVDGLSEIEYGRDRASGGIAVPGNIEVGDAANGADGAIADAERVQKRLAGVDHCIAVDVQVTLDN